MTGTDEPQRPEGAEPEGAEPEGAEAEGVEAATPEAQQAGAAEPAPEPVGWLPQSAPALFGEGASAEEAYALLTVDVPAASWIAALETARDTLGCTYFDWLSAVDEPDTGFRVCAHVAAVPTGTGGGPVHRLIVRTTLPHADAVLPTCTGVYAGAGWHERETHEMFGIGFTGHPSLEPLLLPENFEGHPLRKDFVLAARVAKAWPGAKEPGESGHGAPKRRQMLPPGVPDPNEWGPLKGQLPPVPSRPARGRAASGERPARRTRTASGDAAAASRSTKAAPATEAEDGGTESGTEQPAPSEQAAAPAKRTPRRNRSVSAGSASQQAEAQEHGQGQAEAQEHGQAQAEPGQEAAAEQKPGQAGQTGQAEPGARSSDAPWHHARPAHEPGGESAATAGPEPGDEPESTPGSGAKPDKRVRTDTDGGRTGGDAGEETEGDA